MVEWTAAMVARSVLDHLAAYTDRGIPMRMIMACGLLVGSAAMFAMPLAATADPPARSSWPFTDTQTDRSLCGFPIVLTFTGTVTESDFFDSSGNLVAVAVHSQDVLTATGPTGATASGHEVVDIRVDIRSQTEQHTGVPIHVSGLLIEAGRIFIDANGNVTMTGKNQVLEGDVAKFCSTLA